MYISNIRTWKAQSDHCNLLDPPLAHQLLHVASKVEAGEGFLLLSIILCSLLCLFLFLSSSFVLQRHKFREKENQEWNVVKDYNTGAGVWPYLKTLLSFFLSFAADSLLLCSFRPTLFLYSKLYQLNRSWNRPLDFMFTRDGMEHSRSSPWVE